MKGCIRNESGFSILPVLISMIALGGISYLVVDWSVQVSAVSQQFNNSGRKAALQSAIVASTRTSNACTNALVGNPIVHAPSGSSEGYVDMSLRVGGKNGTQVLNASAEIGDYSLELREQGFRAHIPAGQSPAINGTNRIWTGDLHVVSSAIDKTRTIAGNAPIIFGSIRLTTDASNRLISCELNFQNGCTSGSIRYGKNSSCVTPDNYVGTRCPAGTFMHTVSATKVECKTMAQLIGSLCQSGHVPVSNGEGGVTCVQFK